WHARACRGCGGTAETTASWSSYEGPASRSVVDPHEELVVHVWPVTRLEGGPRVRSHGRQLTRMRKRPLDLGGQVVRISGAEMKSGAPVVDDRADAAVPTADDGQPGGVRLCDDETERLVPPRRHDEDLGLAHQGKNLFLRLPPEPVAPLALADEFFYRRGEGAVTDEIEGNRPAEAPPGGHQRLHALLRREATDEERVAAGAGTDPRIHRTEIRLDRDLVGRQTASDELRPGEIGHRDVGVDTALPGLKPPVRRGHPRYDGGLAARLAITAVADSREWNGFSEAVLAHAAVSIEGGRRTDQTIVVERLHDRNTGIPARVVGGRRHLKERIVEMDD